MTHALTHSRTLLNPSPPLPAVQTHNNVRSLRSCLHHRWQFKEKRDTRARSLPRAVRLVCARTAADELRRRL